MNLEKNIKKTLEKYFKTNNSHKIPIWKPREQNSKQK